ncbi:hypothetical protein N7535_005522 [Penicillium sp. DV-2018c]|nr:hypothetical protein N7461_009096 [Penicillium sp. DV-2018c]KAJ5571862.1 hypothetical protein N7535_005522 [Penicillium sp. DV-2018c]
MGRVQGARHQAFDIGYDLAGLSCRQCSDVAIEEDDIGKCQGRSGIKNTKSSGKEEGKDEQ